MSPARILEIIEEATNEPNLKETTELHSLAGWNSLAVMSLIADVDSEFDLQIDLQKLGKCDSVGEVIALIVAEMNNSSAD